VDFSKIDTDKLARDTGYQAEVTFEEGIRYLVEKRS
jgi:nucleoside-diphosphate-sugar epimerase